jgi:hypothetical protein
MKHLLIYALITCFFFSINACEQTKPVPKITPAVVIAPIRPAIIIDPLKAKDAEQEWQKKRAALIQLFIKNKVGGDSIYIANGYHIPLIDMQNIVANIGNTDQLFGMQAIQKNESGQNEITLIFQAPDKNGVLQYYDFTKPCPLVCPSSN